MILKTIIINIFTPIQYIFNLLLNTDVFPHLFITIPLHKQLNKIDCTNHQSISLIVTLSKVLEKCIKDRLEHFLETF